MKILNIDYHINGYGVEINNCIEYVTSAGASFYNKEFLQLYCGFWSVYSNYEVVSKVNNIILKQLGLEMIYEVEVTEDTLIDVIKREIDNSHPLIFHSTTSAIFYLIGYMTNTNFINHAILINGYDDEKRIIFFREISINYEVLSRLTDKQPFSTYQMTYDMIVDIFKKNKELNISDYSSKALSFIKRTSIIDTLEIKNEFLLIFDYYLNMGTDNLIIELKNIISTKKYEKYLANEQFRRTYYCSLRVIFDIIENKSKFKYDNNYYELKKQFLELRNILTSVLSRNSIKKEKVNVTKLNNYILKIQNINKDLHAYFNKYINKKYFFSPNNINHITNKSTNIWADSELTKNNVHFYAKNVGKEVEINRNNYVWFSTDEEDYHWLIIDFSKKISIKKIVIEHHYILKYITNHYQIYGSNNCTEWTLIKNITDNRDVINIFDFKISLFYQYLKIFIIVANEYCDSIARINKIDVF